MSSSHPISNIYFSDKKSLQKEDILLEQEGIRRDTILD